MANRLKSPCKKRTYRKCKQAPRSCNYTKHTKRRAHCRKRKRGNELNIYSISKSTSSFSLNPTMSKSKNTSSNASLSKNMTLNANTNANSNTDDSTDSNESSKIGILGI